MVGGTEWLPILYPLIFAERETSCIEVNIFSSDWNICLKGTPQCGGDSNATLCIPTANTTLNFAMIISMDKKYDLS